MVRELRPPPGVVVGRIAWLEEARGGVIYHIDCDGKAAMLDGSEVAPTRTMFVPQAVHRRTCENEGWDIVGRTVVWTPQTSWSFAFLDHDVTDDVLVWPRWQYTVQN